MAGSIYDVIINANAEGLTTAVNNSMDELNKLDSVANGLFSNFTGPLNGLKDGLNTINSMTPAMKALGVAGLAAGAGMMAISQASEVVNELNEISTSTGLSVESLQQLSRQFKDTGMDAAAFGDINADAMDKLGDSIREGGGGVADDLEKWGIQLESLTKYASDAEGGVKAVVDVFYQMKEAGKSQAQIVNAMESVASGSSKMINQLSKYKNMQEAMLSVGKQNVDVTNRQAAEYKKFQANTAALQTNMNSLLVRGVNPLITGLNNLWAAFSGNETDILENRVKNTQSKLDALRGRLERKTVYRDKEKEIQDRKALNQQILDTELELSQAKYDVQIRTATALAQDNYDRNQQEIADNKRIAEVKQEKAQEEADKALRAQEQAASKAQAAAAKATAEHERQLEERLKNQQEYLKKTVELSDLIAGTSSKDVFGENLVDVLGSDYKTLSKSFASGIRQMRDAYQSEFNGMTGSEYADSIVEFERYIETRKEMLKKGLDAQKITMEQYAQEMTRLRLEEQAQQDAQMSVNPKMLNMQDLNSIGYLNDEENQQFQEQQLHNQFSKFYENNESMYATGLIQYEDYLSQKERLDSAYAIKSQAIERQSAIMKIGIADDLANGLAGIAEGLAGENSKAAAAMFAVSKGISIANGILNAHESATKAMAMYPGPVGYAMAAGSYAQVMGQVMAMKNVSGQFHDGIDNVPNTGTYILESGERVVDKRLNEDLKEYLKDSDKETGSGQVIDASVNISGNVTDQRWFAEQLNKHKNTIAQLVSDSNRRKQ